MSAKGTQMTKVRAPAKPALARSLLAEVRQLILQARAGLARAVDSGLTTLYWHVGRRIRQDILKEKRAEYGEKIVHALSAQLIAEFGRGFTMRNLFRMIRFAEVFPDHKIVSALRTQLGWTHFRQIIAMDDPLKRTSTRKCAAWSVGAHGHWKRRSAPCSSSARHSLRSRTS